MMAYRKILNSMFKNIVIYIIFVPLIIFSQTNEIKENQPGKVSKNETKEKMFFQGVSEDRLIFYDARNKLYFLRYRKDKWDYENRDRIKELIEGYEYLVVFFDWKESEGFNNPGQEQFVRDGNADEGSRIISKSIRKPGKIVMGSYKSHTPVITDSLRGL